METFKDPIAVLEVVDLTSVLFNDHIVSIECIVPFRSHVSCVMCRVSCVVCHVLCVMQNGNYMMEKWELRFDALKEYRIHKLSS